MARFVGVIGTQVAVTGATTITIDDRIIRNSNTPVWDAGCFGISVTQMGTQSVSCYVVGDLQGIQVPIAGLSGIATTTSTLLPIVNERVIGTNVAAAGSTQTAKIGIPTPRQIVFGNSGIVGQTYSAVVSAMLYATE